MEVVKGKGKGKGEREGRNVNMRREARNIYRTGYYAMYVKTNAASDRQQGEKSFSHEKNQKEAGDEGRQKWEEEGRRGVGRWGGGRRDPGGVSE